MLAQCMKEKVNSKKAKLCREALFFRCYFLLLPLCIGVSAVNLSCSSKQTDLRSLAPADSLIYLETNDLAAAIAPLVDSRSFSEAARSKPDLSPVKGVQLAIAVTGFETTENPVSDEGSELNFRPHFVAIADTHTWGWQTRSFTEDQLGEFVNKLYGGGVKLEVASKDGGTSYVWSSGDGRNTYAFVTESLIFFGNDESSIDRIQAVRRGEADPIAKTGKLPNGADALAVGYVSPEGVGQVVNIIGAQKAKESGEETEVQSFVARVLPQLLRGAIKEATWSAKRTDEGFEDKLNLEFDPEIAPVLNETLAAGGKFDGTLLELAPTDGPTVTAYDLKNPQIAWRSLVLTAQKLLDPASSQVIASLSNSFFEPYGIKNGEKFLEMVSPSLVTVKYEDEDDVAVIARAIDSRALSDALDKDFIKTPGSFVQVEQPGFENVFVVGDPQVVAKCIASLQSGQNLRRVDPVPDGQPPVVRTVGYDRDTAVLLASVLSEPVEKNGPWARSYKVETRMNKTGMERLLVSEFGLIGSLAAMLAPEE